MIRKFSIYASVLVLLCACQKENVASETDGEPIKFSSANFCMETKADPGTIDFPTTRDMGVYAWRSDNAWSTTPALVAFISNAKAVYDDDDELWVTTPTYKWPSPQKKLHFLCYSPYSAASPVSWSNSDGLKISGYTASGADLCFSDFTLDQSREKGVGTPADILMHHALSKVSFALSPKDVPAGLAPFVSEVKLNIVSLSLSGIMNKGDFSASLSTGGTWTGAAWSNQSGTATVVYTDGSVVLPQTLAENKQKITVTYTITVTYSSDTEHPVTSGQITETHDLKCAACGAWEINNHYIYTIKLDAFGDELTFNPASADWDVDDEVIIKIGYEDPTI